MTKSKKELIEEIREKAKSENVGFVGIEKMIEDSLRKGKEKENIEINF